MTAFISGPITKRLNTYQYAFADAEMVLNYLGYKVLNPAWLPKGLKDEDYQRIDDAMLQTADVVVLLKGWERSKGARHEARLAEQLGKKLIEYEQMDMITEKEGAVA